MDTPEFHIMVAICAALVLKNVGIAVLTAGARTVAKKYINPEDARLLGGDTQSDDRVERFRRAHAHSTENDYAFMVLYVLFQMSGADAFALQAYGYTYLFARLAHLLCYAAALQPFRTLSFLVGTLATVGVAVQLLMVAFG
ncbi:MAG: MAPEG family protein [Alphaproteobacteria bacterium]|nr:MAPEG family protein [Alphaproteobacteria bacterium]